MWLAEHIGRLVLGVTSRSLGWLLVCLSCSVLGGGGWPVGAMAEEATFGSTESTLASNSLTIEGALTAEQQQAAEGATLANPEVQARLLASASAYEGLSVEAAERLAGEVFPRLIDEPAGGPPKLPEGEQVEAYVGAHAARVSLGDGRLGLFDSLGQVAVAGSGGSWEPVDLGLEESGGGYHAKRSGVPVRLSANLSEGVSLPGVGVSLTPLAGSSEDAAGAAMGSMDGYAVFWGASSMGADVDLLARAMPAGADLLTVLRSARSPEVLRFRVGMPPGSRLVQEAGSGFVQVVEEGQAVGTLAAPEARDAEGRSVPLSLSVAGDVVALKVEHPAGRWAFPLVVDPYVVNDEGLTGAGKPTNWKFAPVGAPHFTSSGWGGAELVLESTGFYGRGESGFLSYQTQGEAKIYEASLRASGANEGNMETYLQLASSKGVEDTTFIAGAKSSFLSNPFGVCASWKSTSEESCNTPPNKFRDEYGTPDNWVHMELSSTAEGSGHNYVAVSSASVLMAQEHGPEASFNTNATINIKENGKTVERENVLHVGSKGWLGPHAATAFEAIAKDPGVGISYFGVTVGSYNIQRSFYEEGKCSGVICYPEVREPITYNAAMVDGEDNVEILEKDLAMKGAFGTIGQAKVRVDSTPPYNLQVSGLPANGVLSGAAYGLVVQATDGSGSTASSGIKSLEVGVDGRSLPAGRSGSCEPGPCTASGEWTLNAEEFGAGKHTLELVATDYAGNKEIKPYEFTVRHPGPIGTGPGSVDPISGAFTLGTSDVSIGGGYGALGVSRSFNSRELTAGEEGPLGSQWSISLSGEQGLESEPTGAVTLVAEDGSRTTFASDGKGGFISPKGDENLVLSAEREGETVKAYLLKDPAKGTTLRFIHPSGASGSSLWVVEKAEGALSKETGERLAYKWEVLEGVERPKEALAPPPPGVSCEPEPKVLTELKIGCRALSFAYANETKASGEAPSEWGEYKGRLSKVSFTAYDPATKAMVTKVVAEYAYDKQGRLRAEWDPRIETPLKTTYGYDTEGRVVAVNPPGQEPWLLHYGSIAGDPGGGRLLSALRPPASAELNGGGTPGNESKPSLSTTTPVIGTTLSVSSNGSWSGSPLTYAYQWKDCDFKGEKCASVPGAVNASYTPQARDAGYTLVASVTAINADGTGVASTAASGTLSLPAAKYALKFGALGEGAGQFKSPTGAAIDASGNVWVVDHNNNRIEEFAAPGLFLEAVGWGVANGEAKLEVCTSGCRAGIAGSGNGQLSTPDGVAISGEDIFVADAGNNRIEELNTKGEFVRGFGSAGWQVGQLENPVAVSIAPSGNVWVADRGKNRINEFSATTGASIGAFGSTGTGNGQFKEPAGVAFSGEYAYVVDSGDSRVEQFTLSGGYVSQFGTAGSGSGQFSKPAQIATEPVSGGLWVADNGNSRIEEFNQAGVFLTSVGSVGEAEGQFKGVEGLTVTSAGKIYAADLSNDRVQEFTPSYSTNNPAPAAPNVGSDAVVTLDYQVPVSGTGAPYQLSGEEVKKGWSQEDDPVEGTAVFPPDEPMGWPAMDYTKATISYLDSLGRTVNVASPSGGISTTEYNETNDVVRTLSPSNRATALKEGAKSAEVAKLLDTQDTYNAQGTELLEALGPQHMVKLANGEEKLARKHIHNYYDEGAPSGETYGLMTKSVTTAQSGIGQYDEHKTVTSYSGQEGLGWLLRKPTSITVDPRGAKLVTRTVYDRRSGSVIETKSPDSDRAVPAAVYSSQFGSFGTGNGQFNKPNGAASDSKGDIWVLDKGNYRIQEFSPTGEYIRQFGSKGTGNGQFEGPEGIAIDSQDNVWVTDKITSRVQEFSPTGAYVRQFGSAGTGNGQLNGPTGITVDAKSDVWVVDTGNNRVEEFSAAGEFIRQVGSSGSGSGQFTLPYGIAIDLKGNVWVTDFGHSRVEEFTSTGTYLRQFGSEGSGGGQFLGPEGITAENGDQIWVTDTGNNRVQEFSLAGEYIAQVGTGGTSNGQFEKPQGLTFDTKDNLWVTDTGNNRMQKLVPNPAQPVFLSQFGSEGTGNGQFKEPYAIASDSESNVWIADMKNNRVQEFTNTEYLRQFGSYGTGNGQFAEPRGIATDPKGDVWVADTGNNRVQEFSKTGGYLRQFGTLGIGNGQLKAPVGVAIDSNENVWVVDSANNRVQEFSNTGGYLRQFGTTGTGNGQFKGPTYIAIDLKGNVWVTDSANNRVQEFSSTGEYIRQLGTEGTGNGQFKEPSGIVTDAKGNVWIVDANNARVQEFSPGGEYLGGFGSSGGGPGQFIRPHGIALDPSGNMWVMDSVLLARASEWAKFKTPHETRMIYYTPSVNTGDAACGNHPEWANLPCRSRPTVQPSTGNPLPVVTDTYDLWDEPETVTEAFGSTTRTKKSIYDNSGRLTGSEVTSSSGAVATLPKVIDEYDKSTGAMIKQSTTVGERTQSITSAYNRLGQLTEYTDADNNKSTYVYDVDGRTSEMNDGKGAQTYAYNPTTGTLSKLFDTNASMTFTASYDTEGRLKSESYPNGMTAKYTYDEAGQATHLEYVKETHCAESCVWFSESVSYSIHGQALSRASNLASENYTYDNAGRLTQVQETPVGKGCVTRVYAYDEDSNRLSLTTREPAAENKCAASGGNAEGHVYDEADRLSDTGVSYDAFGNTTILPAADAEGHEIKSSYYVSNQTHSTNQNGKTLTYELDPDARSREITSEEGATKTSVVNHYPGPGSAICWTSEGSEKYTRSIPGIDGALSAVEQNGQAPTLQLHDLQGNITTTAALSETEAKPLTTYNSTEFGVPVNGTPPTKYSWLGAAQVSPEFASGATASHGGGYVPQLGRPLQTQPVVPPGSAPESAYVSPYITQLSPESVAQGLAYGAEAPMREAARQKAAEKEAEEKAGGGAELGGDPFAEGLMTGKEALTLAHELNKEGETLAGYTREETCAHAFNPNPAACELGAEIGEKEDPALGKALEGCWFQVHNPGWVHKHFYTKTCLVSFKYEIGIGGNRVIAKGWHVSICFSYQVGAHAITYSTSSWWCESDKKWWNFYNRGWWEDT